jgi:hypothetical protein
VKSSASDLSNWSAPRLRTHTTPSQGGQRELPRTASTAGSRPTRPRSTPGGVASNLGHPQCWYRHAPPYDHHGQRAASSRRRAQGKAGTMTRADKCTRGGGSPSGAASHVPARPKRRARAVFSSLARSGGPA